MTKDEIVQILKNQKGQKQSVININKLGLFGSAARDENTEGSDIVFILAMDYIYINNYIK